VVIRPNPKCFTRGAYAMAIVLLAIAMLAIPAAAENGDETRSTVEFGPDLAVSAGEIIISNTPLLSGVEFNVTIKVYNLGDEDAFDVDVDLLVDTEPVERVTIEQVTVDGWEIAGFELALTQGVHEITVLVDADDAIDERREDNNDASLEVTVKGLPDGSITAKDITVSNAHPYEGDVVTINATVHNLGESDATLVVVQFWDGLPEEGLLIDNRTTGVLKAGQAKVSITWDTTGLGGTHVITVNISRVIPGEDNLGNNMATATVLVFTEWDLVIDTETGDKTIDQERIQDGFVTVRDGATLTIRDADFEFLQDYNNQFALFVEDGGNLVLDDAVVYSNYDLLVFLEDGTSLLLTSGAELTATVVLTGATDVTIEDSLVDGALTGMATSVTVYNSIVTGEISLEGSTLLVQSSSLYAATPFVLQGTNAVFQDCMFNGTADPSMSLIEGATLELRNVTLRNVRTDASSTALVFRRVDVQVVDESTLVIPEANIEIWHFINGTVVGAATGGTDGWASIEVLSDVLSDSESHFIGNYIVWASFSGKVGTEPLLLTPYPAMDVTSNNPSAIVVLPPVEPSSLIDPTPGDMVISAGESEVLNDKYIQDGNIVVRGSLIVSGSVLSVLQDRDHQFYVVVEGNGKLMLSGGGITSNLPINVYLYDNATLELGPGSSISVNALVVEDGATVIGHGSMISARLLLRGGQISLDSGCVLEGDILLIEGPIVRLEGGSILADELHVDSPAVSIESMDINVGEMYLVASFANVTGSTIAVRRITVEATILTITESTVTAGESLNLTVATLYMDSSSSNMPIRSDRADSKVYLYDAEVPRPFILGNGTVMVFWYLTVMVQDSLANPVADSEVEVTFTRNETLVASGVTNADGQVRFPLLGSIVEPDGEYFLGNYRVMAHGPKDSDKTVVRYVNLDQAKTLWVGFDYPIVPPDNIEVEIFIANTTVVAGTEFTITGTATAEYRAVRRTFSMGEVEILMWNNESTWSNTTTLSENGTFSFNVPAPNEDNVYYIKAVVTPNGDFAEVPSNPSRQLILDVIAPGPTSLFIVLQPNEILNFPAGSMLVIKGWVRYNTAQGVPAANVRVFVDDPVNSQRYQTHSDGLGLFEFDPRVGPLYYGQEDYFLTALDEELDIETPESFKLTVFAVEPPEEEEESSNFLWYSIIIVVIVVVAIAGTLGYWAFSSKGRMVECGECGTLVPESATVCPRCNIEFEVEVAKCSVCESWIKSDATVCPYCNTPFSDMDEIGEEDEGGEAAGDEEAGAGGDVIAEIPESDSALSDTFNGSEEVSEVAIKQVPEGLKKEVRPRPVVQKRAVKEIATDPENANHAHSGENGHLKPRVVKKIPTRPVEEEVVLEETEVDLYMEEDEGES